MGTIDIIIAVWLAAAALLGLLFGYGKKGVNRLCTMLGILAGYYFGVPSARGVMNTVFGFDILTNAYITILPKTEVFTQDLIMSTSESQLGAALSALNIPTFFHGVFLGKVTVTTSTVATGLASSFAFLTLIAFFFLLFFLPTFFLAKFLLGGNKDRDGLFGENGRNFLGRIAGAVHRVFQSTLTILLIFAIVILVSELLASKGITVLQDWLNADLKLEESSFSIGRLFYNLASSFMKWIN